MDSTHKPLGQIRLKFCGLKQQEEINLCHILNIEFIGFVFYKNSIRNIQIEEFNALKTFQNQKTVAVFQNANAKEIISTVSKASNKIDFIQPHGTSLEDLLVLFQMGYGIIKPFHGESFTEEDFLPYCFCEFFLFDERSGSGIERDFSFTSNLPTNKPFFLAGGINTNNLENALQFSNMLDLSSGIEEIRGRKSLKLMEEFHKKALKFENKL